MGYKVSWNKASIEDLKELPRNIALSIHNKINDYISQEPRKNGKPLQRELKGLWVAKHARHRIIYEIFESEKTIVILEVGYRKNI